MSGLIMFIILIGIIYYAFTYLKGTRNSDTRRDGFHMHSLNDTDNWNEETPPELSIHDEMEMEADGEDMDEISFGADESDEADEAGDAPQNADMPTAAEVPADDGSISQEAPADDGSTKPEAPAADESTKPVAHATEASATEHILAANNPTTPAAPAAPTTPAPTEVPPSYINVPDQQYSEVVVDSEVRIDAQMPSDNNK